MKRSMRLLLAVAAGILAMVVAPVAALADHANRPHTKNMHALGHSPNPASFLVDPPGPAPSPVNSDLAFQGRLVFNGNYDGFRILRRSPGNPKQISWTRCQGNQGDIVVWGDILVRAWNSPAAAGATCDGQPVPEGFEGMHVFDISNLEDPELVGDIELSARPQADMPGCGTHTLTLVPDLADGRVLIYNATSGGNAALPPALQNCDWLDIIQVPLSNPGGISHLNRVPVEGGHAVHDNGVILGSVNKLAAASGHMANVFSIGAPGGGSPENPQPLFTVEEPGVCNTGGPLCNGNWHSSAFTWDGDTLILGWEPGGGAAPECEATDPVVKKSMFFYDADTGEKLGQWTLPRPQTAEENCTIHNYNTVPIRSGRDVVVGGHYQAGTWVVDITNPANPETLGWSDPPPLVPTQLGGAWSSYWYNGFIYESSITEGVNVFRFSGKQTAGAIRLPHLNPQTQEFSLPN